MERILISETPRHIGETVKLAGWVHIRRDHGKLVFIELRDRSGRVQLVVLPDKPALALTAKEVRSEFAIVVTGKVKMRPGRETGVSLTAADVELEAETLAIVGRTEGELPVDVSKSDLGLQLETLLNFRTLTLRNEKIRAIFSLYSKMLAGYAMACRAEDFLEIKTPKIVSAATEGGANFFKIKYFDREAYLAQSPQFYKQAGATTFERVFEIGSVFRAEPHYTSRHVNEYVGLDGEMAFIDSFEDVMAMLEKILFATFDYLEKNGAVELALYGAQVPACVPIPRIRLSEAAVILKREYGKEVTDGDLDSEAERMMGEYVKKTYGSDLVFLTHYTIPPRPFYSMRNAEDSKYTDTFDLIYRGVEIATGGQRIHEYATMVEAMRRQGLDPEQFQDYLDIFRYGAPPHGGWGLGSERIIQQLLGLGSIKETVLYPRDVKRLTP